MQYTISSKSRARLHFVEKQDKFAFRREVCSAWVQSLLVKAIGKTRFRWAHNKSRQTIGWWVMFQTSWISSIFLSFLAIVFTAFSFRSSNILVPAASSIIPRISWGFMFKTFVILPKNRRFEIDVNRVSHIQSVGELTLHNQEIGIVDVQLDRLKEILDWILGRAMPVYQILGSSSHQNLHDWVGIAHLLNGWPTIGRDGKISLYLPA